MPDEPGDVRLADGTAVWLDAGPLRFVDPIDGVPVVHVVNVEHGAPTIPVTNHSTAELAPDQLEAVTHPGGAARIIAPAGSGKTRVLTERARHLLTNWRLPSSAVSLVAFNKRAQEEMRERTPDLVGLHVRTLNAIALAIVNGTAPFAAQPSSWRTINEVDVRRIIGDLVSFPKRRNSDPVAPWIEALSLVRLGLVAPDEVEARYEGDVEGFAAFWPSYRALLERKHLVDFDDQIYRALMILLSDPAARRTAQRACRTMLVDEFQDLTPAHLLLIRLLAAPGGAVFGVGDDDQTIYGYNGADPGWLIDFGELFPSAGAHPLEVNYRCPAGIVEIADRLLRHNQRRVAKTIRADSTDPGGWSVDTSVDPVAATTGAVRSALSAGAEPQRGGGARSGQRGARSGAGGSRRRGDSDLGRRRSRVRGAHRGSQRARRGSGSPRPTNAGGFFPPTSARRCGVRPGRFIPGSTPGSPSRGRWSICSSSPGRLNNERDADRLMEFAADIQTLQKVVQSGAPDLRCGDHADRRDRARRLGVGARFDPPGDEPVGPGRRSHGDSPPRRAPRRRRDVRLVVARPARDVTRSSDGVVLSTVHRVKGQEWPHVVVHHVDAEQYPHRLADDVEEERRLFHVAITRASTHATVVTGPRSQPVRRGADDRAVSAAGRVVAPPRTGRDADPRAEEDRPDRRPGRCCGCTIRSVEGPADRTRCREAGLRGVRQQDPRRDRPRRADHEAGAVAHLRCRAGEARQVRRRVRRADHHARVMFDRVVVVDWSASSRPVRGRDSIWIAVADVASGEIRTSNPETRSAACGELDELCRRPGPTLLGVDFSLGYPAGTARALGLSGTPWRAMWNLLAELVVDADDNTNNRFEVAAELNRRIGQGPGPFWGCPPSRRVADTHLDQGRIRIRSPSGEPSKPGSAGPGTVRSRAGSCSASAASGARAWSGSRASRQLERTLVAAGRTVEVWPFGAWNGGAPTPDVVIAEVWPSLHPLPELERPCSRRGAGRGDGTPTRRSHRVADRHGTDRRAASEAVRDEEGWVLGA